jgi:AraC family transcriptional regulator
LLKHLTKDIDLQPQIIFREEINLVGLKIDITSPFSSKSSYCDDLYPTWMELLRRQSEISNKITDTFYGLTVSPSGDFTEKVVNYIAAIPVKKMTEAPKGMVYMSLPEQMVAVFDISTVESDTVNKTIDYIYGYWLPNSGYERGVGNDYELFENTTYFTNPELTSRYIIPLK